MTPSDDAVTGPGLVLVDKPAGITSHGVVARIRRLSGVRKVGHAGTLDPMATGLLVVGVGRATRLLGHLVLTEKRYDATVRLGAATTTDDAEGEVLSQADAGELGDDQIRAAFAALVGRIEQVPSAVSAIKVDGQRAYRRVRAGEDVSLAARTVQVHELRIVDLGTPAATRDVRISVRCSSGTYVRALARDAGAALGVGGHLTALRRTSVGSFGLDRAQTLEELATELTVLPLAAAARESFPAVDIDESQARAVVVGKPLAVPLPGAGPVAVFGPGGTFLALYEDRGEGTARPVAVFVG